MEIIGYVSLGIVTGVMGLSILLVCRDTYHEIKNTAKADAKRVARRKLRQEQACRSDWFPE